METKSPWVARTKAGGTGGVFKRDKTLSKVLEPIINVTEEVLEESNFTTIDDDGGPESAFIEGAKTRSSNRETSSGAATSALKPLNHTPVLKGGKT